jgi:hypothetical protein
VAHRFCYCFTTRFSMSFHPLSNTSCIMIDALSCFPKLGILIANSIVPRYSGPCFGDPFVSIHPAPLPHPVSLMFHLLPGLGNTILKLMRPARFVIVEQHPSGNRDFK